MYIKFWNNETFFWSIFSCIRTEYEDLLHKSPYSTRIQENTDQKKLHNWTLFTQCEIDTKLKLPIIFLFNFEEIHICLFPFNSRGGPKLLFKVNKKDATKSCKVCLKIIMKILEQCKLHPHAARFLNNLIKLNTLF